MELIHVSPFKETGVRKAAETGFKISWIQLKLVSERMLHLWHWCHIRETGDTDIKELKSWLYYRVAEQWLTPRPRKMFIWVPGTERAIRTADKHDWWSWEQYQTVDETAETSVANISDIVVRKASGIDWHLYKEKRDVAENKVHTE